MTRRVDVMQPGLEQPIDECPVCHLSNPTWRWTVSDTSLANSHRLECVKDLDQVHHRCRGFPRSSPSTGATEGHAGCCTPVYLWHRCSIDIDRSGSVERPRTLGHIPSLRHGSMTVALWWLTVAEHDRSIHVGHVQLKENVRWFSMKNRIAYRWVHRIVRHDQNSSEHDWEWECSQRNWWVWTAGPVDPLLIRSVHWFPTLRRMEIERHRHLATSEPSVLYRERLEQSLAAGEFRLGIAKHRREANPSRTRFFH